MDEKRVRCGRLFPGSRAFEAVGMAFYVVRGVAHHYSIGIKVIPAISIPDPAAAYQGAVRERILPLISLVQPASALIPAGRAYRGICLLRPDSRNCTGECQGQT